ncbi:cytochrome P450 CYP12A2-like [Diabrotica virgifera virgifera]|uniref:Cytochrome P450 12a5, mitochondrial n=1 Tax=Diabrotica virgifera virgifera TaxID=50390 RepID=A0ABM5KKR0_DIAVI|nr:cytochrome P450 CYP12A2-like [Diabrotica virgifera virgifera]
MADLFRNTGPFPSRLTFDYILYHRTKLRKDVFKGYVGLALSQGEDWYKLRTIVNPILMQPNKIQQYTTRLDTVAKDLIKLTKYRMKTAGTNQTPADFEKDLYKWALDSVSVITLNKQVGALETHIDKTSELYQFVLSVLKIFEQIHYLELMPPYWKYLPSRRLNEFYENFEFSMSLISKFVDEALAEFKNVNIPDDELGVLQRLAKVNKQTAYLMTIDLITAGVDATGKTLGTALYLLAKNPEKQSILREEVLKYLPEKNSVLTAEKLSEMQYLKATLKESNRMAPVAIGGLRTTTKNMVLGGYQVPKGTDINPMHFYASALIDKNFKDPAKFMPERWLRSVSNEYSAKNAHPFAYMPFGHGARSCIGRRFAVMEVEVAIANIIRHFELSWDHSDMRFEARFLYGIVDPLTLTLKEIKIYNLLNHTVVMLSKRALRLKFSPLLQTGKYSTATNRENFYKQLIGSSSDDAFPEGWENAKPFKSMPGPKPLPVLGNMWRFFPGQELHGLKTDELLLKFQQGYGDVVHFGGIWGRRDKVFLYNPDDMEYLFRNTGPFPSRMLMDCMYYYRKTVRKDLHKGNNIGLAFTNGEEWYKLRTIVNPILMQPKTVQQYTTRMDSAAKDLMKLIRYRMKSEGTNQTPADFENDLYKWALDSISIIALNRKLGALDTNTDKNSDLYKFVVCIMRMFELIFYLEYMPPYWKYFPSKELNEFCEKLDFINSVIIKMIDEALATFKNQNVPDDELGVLQRLTKVNKETAFIMTMDMLTAGVDTTGKTLGAVLYFLAKNPEKQSTLREEVLKYLPEKDSVLTADKLSEMQYLKAVLKESSRIAPVAISGLRTTSKNMIVGGYQVPKGIDVTPMHFYASTMIDKNFKEPSRFMPERWLRSVSNEYSAKNAHPFAYMPFGHGARSCIGRRFATLEVEVAVANMIRNFELSWDYPDMRFEAKFLYGLADPLKLTLKELK